jgi:putative Holliday junction resolvase
MALDVGDARIGLALSDPLGILARPLQILTRTNLKADIQTILDIIRDTAVSRIIVGIPINMDGTSGGQAQKTQQFVNELRLHTALPIEFKDERLTTVEAKNILRSSRKTDRKTRYDAAAAALILQSYLDEHLPPQEIPEDGPSE